MGEKADLIREACNYSFSSERYLKMTFSGVEPDMDRPVEIANNAFVKRTDSNFFVTLSCNQTYFTSVA